MSVFGRAKQLNLQLNLGLLLSWMSVLKNLSHQWSLALKASSQFSSLFPLLNIYFNTEASSVLDSDREKTWFCYRKWHVVLKEWLGSQKIISAQSEGGKEREAGLGICKIQVPVWLSCTFVHSVLSRKTIERCRTEKGVYCEIFITWEESLIAVPNMRKVTLKANSRHTYIQVLNQKKMRYPVLL